MTTLPIFDLMRAQHRLIDIYREAHPKPPARLHVLDKVELAELEFAPAGIAIDDLLSKEK